MVISLIKSAFYKKAGGRGGFLSICISLESKEIRNTISKIPPKVPPSIIDGACHPIEASERGVAI
jgi:hypothetical protein